MKDIIKNCSFIDIDSSITTEIKEQTFNSLQANAKELNETTNHKDQFFLLFVKFSLSSEPASLRQHHHHRLQDFKARRSNKKEVIFITLSDQIKISETHHQYKRNSLAEHDDNQKVALDLLLHLPDHQSVIQIQEPTQSHKRKY